MQRQAAIATAVIGLTLAACAEQLPTAPGIDASRGGPLFARSADAGLTLHPSGFGQKSYAAWKAKEGKQDDAGNGDHALYFQKMVPTTTFAAGVAVIDGVEGLPASSISGLSWEHRLDGHCGAGAPRWNLNLSDAMGHPYTVFLGCAAAVHTPSGMDERGRPWMLDVYPGLGPVSIAQQVLAQTGLNVTALTVRSLVIVFDEGNDLGGVVDVDAGGNPIGVANGRVHLDNITVEVNGVPHTFTGPSDNGAGR